MTNCFPIPWKVSSDLISQQLIASPLIWLYHNLQNEMKHKWRYSFKNKIFRIILGKLWNSWLFTYFFLAKAEHEITQPAFTGPKLTIGTLEQGEKYVQS